MSILIKGAALPMSCEECQSVLGLLFCKDFLKEYIGESELLKHTRLSDCPLVEIPPHGRLIDASEMAIKFNCRDIDITTLKNLHECLMEIPTVIESEE